MIPPWQFNYSYYLFSVTRKAIDSSTLCHKTQILYTYYARCFVSWCNVDESEPPWTDPMPDVPSTKGCVGRFSNWRSTISSNLCHGTDPSFETPRSFVSQYTMEESVALQFTKATSIVFLLMNAQRVQTPLQPLPESISARPTCTAFTTPLLFSSSQPKLQVQL